MEPMPYRIREEDIDEVLSAYEPMGGGEWTATARQAARAYVMRNVLELDETVMTSPEDDSLARDAFARARSGGDDGIRRETALAAIEDLLIRDGFLNISDREMRVFPAITVRDDEHDDV